MTWSSSRGRPRFTVPLRPLGTAFQRRVWEAIGAIPLAESRTYGEIARSVRSSARAVGQACGANRVALIIRHAIQTPGETGTDYELRILRRDGSAA